MEQAKCRQFEGSGKFPEAPPCLQLKHFLTEGDSLYRSWLYYCFDCQRIWCHTSETYVTNDEYWRQLPFDYLLHPHVWTGWLGMPDGPMKELEDGIAGLESWLATLNEPMDATTPI
jgi:hypothetical protein